MKLHKLISDEDFSEDFSLIAIHCSEEPPKMAFLLNQYVHLRLRRKEKDHSFSAYNVASSFPLYFYNDEAKYTCFHLISNKCKSVEEGIQSPENLFSNHTSEKYRVSYLLPEFKKADYLLKIYSDLETVPLKNFISQINEINQVITAYWVDVDSLKSVTPLIFAKCQF